MKFNLIYEQLMNQLNKTYQCQNITLVALPGSFKPPHKGHWEMIMKYYNMPEVKEIHVFISNVSTKVISKKILSKTNLNPLFKIIQNFQDNKYNYTNQSLVHKLDMCFNQIKSKVDSLNYSILKDYIDDLIQTFNEVKTNEFDEIIDKLYKYIKGLKDKLFNNVRIAKNNIQIEPQTCKKILDMYVQTYGVSDKVKIRQPGNPTPMMSVTGFVNNACNNCIVYLGCSKKGDDGQRWNQYLKAFKPNNEVIPKPVDVSTLISATDIRNNIDNLQKDWFPDKLTDQQFEQIKSWLITPDIN